MWVTQTYLGRPDREASAWVYYLYENYDPDQKCFTKQIERELQALGEIYGGNVTFMMPQQQYAATIEKQVRDHGLLWNELSGKLPGIFISKKPLCDVAFLDDDNYYISFGLGDAAAVRKVVSTIRSTIDGVLKEAQPAGEGPRRETFASRMFDALELKLGIAGVRIDLKKLMRRPERR